MKTILVPDDISLKNPYTDEPLQTVNAKGESIPAVYSFAQIFRDHFLSAPELARSVDDLSRLLTVYVPAFKDLKAGDELKLEDADYGRLLPVVSRFSLTVHVGGQAVEAYSSIARAQFLPFRAAFLAAK